MGGGHDHAHVGKGSNARALALTLGLTATYTVAEVIGGLLTGSLALLADAGHMLSDSGSIAVVLVAIWLARRPATAKRSFGFKRAEILAALFNGVTLVAISIWIFIEAIDRFADPPDVLGGWMLAIALGGVAINVAGALILARGDRALRLRGDERARSSHLDDHLRFPSPCSPRPRRGRSGLSRQAARVGAPARLGVPHRPHDAPGRPRQRAAPPHRGKGQALIASKAS